MPLRTIPSRSLLAVVAAVAAAGCSGEGEGPVVPKPNAAATAPAPSAAAEKALAGKSKFALKPASGPNSGPAHAQSTAP